MSTAPILRIHTDGAARGNPGPAAFAFVIARDGFPDIEEADCIGEVTNNQAEYTALVRALEYANQLGTQFRVHIHSDSELMVKQMRGEYKVKNEDLRPLYEKAAKLANRFEGITYKHVRRELNSRADALCNEALDGRRRIRSNPPVTAPSSTPEQEPMRPAPPSPKTLKDQALACLARARDAWKQDEQEPATEAVWEELLGLFRRAVQHIDRTSMD